ncbi:MAG: hypothetical protein JW774_02200 [Candidatus Aureabacteria bacterium]|nr:hypothetical protein [Candidatus Auribacterota bacterium]
MLKHLILVIFLFYFDEEPCVKKQVPIIQKIFGSDIDAVSFCYDSLAPRSRIKELPSHSRFTAEELKAHQETPIVNAIQEKARNAVARYCTPGHMGVLYPGITAGLLKAIEPVLAYDFSVSIQHADDLVHPSTYIRRSEKLMANAFGADRSSMLTGERNQANQLAMRSYLHEGDEVLVGGIEVGTMILDGLAELNVRPTLIPTPRDADGKLTLSPDAQTIIDMIEQAAVKARETLKHLKKERKHVIPLTGYKAFMPRALILCQPSSYGTAIVGLKKIVQKAHEHGMVVHIQERGTPYHFHDDFPESGVDAGADFVVQPFSGIVPGFLQASVIHRNLKFLFEEDAWATFNHIVEVTELSGNKLRAANRYFKNTLKMFDEISRLEKDISEVDHAGEIARVTERIKNTMDRIVGLVPESDQGWVHSSLNELFSFQGKSEQIFNQIKASFVSTSFSYVSLCVMDDIRKSLVMNGNKFLQDVLETRNHSIKVFNQTLIQEVQTSCQTEWRSSLTSEPTLSELDRAQKIAGIKLHPETAQTTGSDPFKISIRFNQNPNGWTARAMQERLKRDPQWRVIVQGANLSTLACIINPRYALTDEIPDVMKHIIHITLTEKPTSIFMGKPDEAVLQTLVQIPGYEERVIDAIPSPEKRQMAMTNFETNLHWDHVVRLSCSKLIEEPDPDTRFVLAEDVIIPYLGTNAIFLRGTVVDVSFRGFLKTLSQESVDYVSYFNISGMYRRAGREPSMMVIPQKKEGDKWKTDEAFSGGEGHDQSLPEIEERLKPGTEAYRRAQLEEPTISHYLEQAKLFSQDKRTTDLYMPVAEAGIPSYFDSPFLQKLSEPVTYDMPYNFDPQIPFFIEKSRKALARLVGAADAYFVPQGSTQSNQIVMQSYLRSGDRVMLTSNYHRSIAGVLSTFNLKPPILIDTKKTTIEEGFVDVGASSEDMISAIRQEVEQSKIMARRAGDETNYQAFMPRAIIITAPTYYGSSPDKLKEVIDEAHAHGMLVHVDEAWGSHLPFHHDFPSSAVELGADYVVTSFHKTVLGLQQSSVAYVSAQRRFHSEEERIRFEWKMRKEVQTLTSLYPNLLMIGAIDAVRKFIAGQYALKDSGIFHDIIRIRKQAVDGSLEGLTEAGIKLLDCNQLAMGEDGMVTRNIHAPPEKRPFRQDPSKLVLNFKGAVNEWNAILVAKILESEGYILELVDPFNIVLLLPLNIVTHEQKLYGLLKIITELVINRSPSDFIETGILHAEDLTKFQFVSEAFSALNRMKLQQVMSPHEVLQSIIRPELMPPGIQYKYLPLSKTFPKSDKRYILTEQVLLYPPGAPGTFLPGFEITSGFINAVSSISKAGIVMHGVEKNQGEPYVWVLEIEGEPCLVDAIGPVFRGTGRSS